MYVFNIEKQLHNYYKTKMRRIVFPLLAVLALGNTLLSCKNNEDPDPIKPVPETKKVSLNIHVPGNVTPATYAGEAATPLENQIDTIYLDLKQAGSLIHQDTLYGSELEIVSGTNDSIINVGIEVDNITTGALTIDAYANRNKVEIITDEKWPVTSDPASLFTMSGSGAVNINAAGTAYEGTVYLVRNVAKLRTNITKHADCIPSDLVIDYANIKIQPLNVPNQTTLLGIGDATGQPGFSYINYAERDGGAGELRHSPTFSASAGGQIDSLYLYENYRNIESSYNNTNTTLIKVTIPTTSATEGSREDSYEFAIYANSSYRVLRNHIYTLNIQVRGHSLKPLVTLDILPWNDVEIDGSIHGTYLSLETSYIEFDDAGKSMIDFCTDAQAMYFDWSDIQGYVPDVLKPIGIEYLTDERGQLLLDQQQCGSFGFELNITDPSSKYIGGKICITAGNINKCLVIQTARIYDAHYIVGDTLMDPGTTYTSATVNDGGTWLQLSKKRLYKPAEMLSSYTASPPGDPGSELFLHLDENLTGASRSATVDMVKSNGDTKRLKITQLPALPVGPFGNIWNTNNHGTPLYTEQIPEEKLLPFGTGTANAYDRYSGYQNNQAVSADFSQYIDGYKNTDFVAANYCLYKNRDQDGSGTIEGNEWEWYLPAQAQLMGMWTSYNGYWNEPTSKFEDNIYWSGTSNPNFPNEAQLVDFSYGNSGHQLRSRDFSVRCVRNNGTMDANLITKAGTSPDEYPVIDFSKGMPDETYSSTSKSDGTGNEQSLANATVYIKLQIAAGDITGTHNWADAKTACQNEGAGWRLPTQRELQAIWALLPAIGPVMSSSPGFQLFNASAYYWSATESSEYSNEAWLVHGTTGNSPTHPKTDLSKVRCVKELP